MSKFVKLKDVCLKITDGAHYSPIGISKGFPMFSVKDMRHSGFDYSDCKYISESDYKDLVKADCKPKIHDVLIAKDGSYLKHVFVVKEEKDEVILSSIGILRPHLNKVNPYYLKYFLHINSVKETVSKKYVSGSALPRIILKNFAEIEIVNNDLPTQQKIASVLSALDDKIELNNRINVELEAMAKTLYDYWFVQFDFPNEEAKPYKSSGGKMVYNETLKREIPEGWEVKTVGDIITKIESGKRPKGGIDKNLKNGIPSLGAESIDRLGVFNYSSTKYIPIEYKEKIKSGIIQNNDILIYKDGAYVGKTTLFRDNFPFEFATINEHVFLVRAKDKYFQEYLLLTLMQKYYFNMMQSLGQKAAQPGLNQEDFKSLKIIVPNDDVLKSFNKQIDLLFGKLFINSKQNQELSALRDWLLPMLMNGQVKVG